MAGRAEATRARRGTGVRITRSAMAAVLALGGLAGCASQPTVPLSAGLGDRVVVLASATSHEPRPMLTERARTGLRAGAQSSNVSDGPDGRGSVAQIGTADGWQVSLPLTPRRTNGDVEYGLQRETLIEDNVREVGDTVRTLQATRPGLDLLQGIEDAVAGNDHGLLILVSNGLSTDGGFDLRQVGWDADPGRIVAQLRERNLLPDLSHWRVLFTGLGETAGDQPPLPKPTRDKLTAYWLAICAASAKSCDVDETRFARTGPAAGPDLPVVGIPDVSSVTGPGGEVTTTLSDRVLGFAGDSATVSPAALDLLGETAARINARLAGQPDALVTVRGYTADPPGSTSEGRLRLSEQRARAVAGALTAAGVTHRIVAVGGATAPGMSAVGNGGFDETRAVAMRRVEITY